MITGGEMADPADCQAALRAAPWARLLNAYGLTETTITSALFDVSGWPQAAPWSAVPVGRPAGPARLMVLDGQLNPVPAGDLGRGLHRRLRRRPRLPRPPWAHRGAVPARPGRCRRGAGCTGPVTLAAGSRTGTPRGRRHGWTASSRCAATASSRERSRACWPGTRTSTRCRWWRRRATRATLAWSPTTRRPAPRRRAALHHPRAASLRRYLLDRLPGYMIPAAFVARHPSRSRRPSPAREPATPGRRADTARARAAPARGPRQSSSRPREAGLSALWARLLSPDHVGLDDEFFALGGNSLLAAEMLAHTRRPLRHLRGLGAPAYPLPAARSHAARVRRRGGGRPRWAPERRRRPGRGRLRPRDQAQPQGPRPRCARHRGRGDAAAVRHGPGWRDPGEVLLTGATGFLGAHLLQRAARRYRRPGALPGPGARRACRR